MRKWLLAGCLCLVAAPVLADAASAVAGSVPPSPLRMVMDVRSTHSDGRHGFDELVKFAEARGVDVLAINERDRFSIRLGIDPIPQILGYSMQHPSLYESGVDRFFADMARLRNAHPELVLLAGTESTPGYHWSGIPFRNLVLHDADRHILTLGESDAAQVTALPSYDLRYGYGSRALSLAFWCALVFSLLIVLLRRRKRSVALLLFASFIAFLASWLLKKPVDADAEFLKAAESEGLFTAWAHPGTLSGALAGPMGVWFDTKPYSARVFARPTADAFAAVYGDADSNCEPGDRWDRFLMDYLNGWHAKPIWAVAAADFHAQGEANEYLGNYPMDVWADARSRAAVLAALKSGRSVAWGMPKGRNIRIAELDLLPAGGAPQLPGGAVVSVPAHVELVTRLAENWPAKQPTTLKGQWIIDGRVAATVVLPINGDAVRLPLNLAPGPHAIRLHIPMQGGIRMEANPFLVRAPS